MPRNWRKAVPESNGPVPQQEEFGLEQPMLVDIYTDFLKKYSIDS